ncbi:MAG TPA: thiamine diphosphokinase [Candidatus Pullichristensenella avicola]|nr:thiamine diphosphokinase [Candidatus Pullichristensenella avicola]
MQGRCWIVGAGDWCARGWAPRAGDIVVAADGGQAPLVRLNLLPDVVVGDFDSLRDAPHGGEVVRLPAEKDDTDMVAALRIGLERGYREFRIYGAAGGRIDHTIANLQSLNFLARQGARGVLVEERYMLTSLLNGEMRFRAGSRGMLSVFAQGGEARGVYLEGLKYEQHGFTLRDDYPMGVSNEFTGVPARVAVRDGLLLVAWTHTALAEGI